MINTGPRVLHCPACLREAVHHFSHDEETGEGTLSWYRCECGELRSLDFVARPGFDLGQLAPKREPGGGD